MNALASLDAFIDRPQRPYPGLRPFRSNEWSIFCGREQAAREVLYLLGDHNVVLVHGGSGCGKSSLIAAGVLPMLRRDMELADRQMAETTIKPSQGPLDALAAALAAQLGFPPRPKAAQLESQGGHDAEVEPGTEEITEPNASVATAAAAWTTALLLDEDIAGLVEKAIVARELQLFCLVVDQFEEIFAWARERRSSDVEVLTRFLANIACAERSDRFFVIVTMRSDFFSQCALFPALGEVINRCQYFVPSLDPVSIERAIREPARIFGGTVGDRLVTRLLTEASTMIDALPILQHALMRMAEPKRIPTEGAPWRIGLIDYNNVRTDKVPKAGRRGGTSLPDQTALSVHAEELRRKCIDQLKKEAGPTIATIFRALLDVDSAGRVVRRPTSLSTLRALAGPNAALVEPIVRMFAEESDNLLNPSIDPLTDTIGMVDISHEALLRNWWRMTKGEGGSGPGWIQHESDDALTWRTLARTAAQDKGSIDQAMLGQIRTSYQHFFTIPETARRYLLKATGQAKVEKEPEWQAVRALIQRSRWALWRRRLFYGAVIAAAVIVAAFFAFEREERARELARQEGEKVTLEQMRLQGEVKALIGDLQEKGGGSDKKLTDVEVVAIQQVSQTPTQIVAQGNPIYMWIGENDVTNLADAKTDAPVLPSAIRPDTRYRVKLNLALRSAMPTPPNKSGPWIGAVRKGGFVRTLGANARWQPNFWQKSQQYWLQVRPEEQPTIYLQYAEGDPKRLLEALRLNYIVPSAQRLELAKGLNEVRYCFEDDKTSAELVQKRIQEQFGRPLQIHWIGVRGSCERIAKPGTIEVWIGKVRGPSAK